MYAILYHVRNVEQKMGIIIITMKILIIIITTLWSMTRVTGIRVNILYIKFYQREIYDIFGLFIKIKASIKYIQIEHFLQTNCVITYIVGRT